ncbi:MAG: peroxidase [Gemmatimonadetes bacterium]|nr:peroxidase [Gemmatimonadota bacterium]
MTWICVIDESEAQGELRAIYQRIAGTRGRVANILKLQSLHPAGLEAHFDLYLALMFGPSPLSRFQRELLATFVSSVNGCHY